MLLSLLSLAKKVCLVTKYKIYGIPIFLLFLGQQLYPEYLSLLASLKLYILISCCFCLLGSVAATVTPQHLLLNRNALFQGGLQPHNYCLPVLKREIHSKFRLHFSFQVLQKQIRHLTWFSHWLSII